MKEVDEVKAIDASLHPIPDVVYKRIVKMHMDMLHQEWDGKVRAQFTENRLFAIWQYRGDYQICRLVQCRAKYNGVPERYNEIIESFNNNKKKYGLFSGRYEVVA